MKRNRFVVAFSAFMLTTGILYFIGHLFTVPLLMFRYEYINYEDGYLISTGSIMPLILGLIISYCVDKVYMHKYRQKLA
ncbi:hypothetical protein CEW92_10575 [Bacillaceae bacterium SAS-127]|nr:hypothetical protein CEW92_10575 [Bacillaceae bacterium SAS-127]